MRYSPETAAEIAGGFVELLFVSMYAFAMSCWRQVITGWIVNGGLCACASGKMYPSGNLDTLLEEIMLEDNETSVTGSCVANNIFPVLQDLLDSGTSTSND